MLLPDQPAPVRNVDTPFAVQRPHASAMALERQGSFRGFEKLQELSSPFKRTLSLRLNDLPSTLQRQSAVLDSSLSNCNGGLSLCVCVTDNAPSSVSLRLYALSGFMAVRCLCVWSIFIVCCTGVIDDPLTSIADVTVANQLTYRCL